MKKEDFVKKLGNLRIEDISLSSNEDYPDSEILGLDECIINDF